MKRSHHDAELLASWRRSAEHVLAHLDAAGSLSGSARSDAQHLSEVLGNPIDLTVREWADGQVTLVFLNSLCQSEGVLKMVGGATHVRKVI